MDTKPAFFSFLGFRPPSVTCFGVKSFDSSVEGCGSPSIEVCYFTVRVIYHHSEGAESKACGYPSFGVMRAIVMRNLLKTSYFCLVSGGREKQLDFTAVNKLI